MPLTAFVTLRVVVDPVGIAPVFLSVTHDAVPARRAIAVRAPLIAATILIGTAIGGRDEKAKELLPKNSILKPQ
jgi:multiple antibiotic resistance protein